MSRPTLPAEAEIYFHPVSRSKDIALVGLGLISSVLALCAWRQQAEIRQLGAREAAATLAAAPGVTIHQATRLSLPVPGRRSGGGTAVSMNMLPERDEGAVRAAVEPRPAGARSRRAGALARLMDNPEFVDVLGRQRQAMLDARFAGLFRQLNLGADELAAFKHLLVEKENVVLDVVTVSETSPQGPLSPESLRASVRAAQLQVEDAIHSALGTERYAIYRDYERTVAQRAMVAQLEQRLSYTAAPLSPAQSEALVRILVATAPAAATETAPALTVVVRAGVPEAVPLVPTNRATGRVTEEVIAQSQSVLTPAQLNALREIQLEQQAAAKAAELIREALPAREEMPAFGLTLLLQ